MATMRHLNYIPDDGYTEPGYIAGVPGLHPRPLRFTFRPPLPEERVEHAAALEQLKGVQEQLACHAFIAEKLKTWDHVDKDGKPIPVSAVNVGRMKPALVNLLYAIVAGYAASEIDPDWGEETKQEVVAVAYQSAKFDAMPGEVRQQEAEGN